MFKQTNKQKKLNRTEPNSPIDVTIMAILCFVFDMSGIDSNLSCLFFGWSVNVFVGHGFCPTGFAQNPGDGLCKGCLSVIDVTNRSDVHMGFAAIEIGGKSTGERETEKISVAVGGRLRGPWAKKGSGRLGDGGSCGCGSREHIEWICICLFGRQTRMDLYLLLSFQIVVATDGSNGW